MVCVYACTYVHNTFLKFEENWDQLIFKYYIFSSYRMFLAYSAALSRPQVENLHAYILAVERMEASSEVGSGFFGRAGHPSPVLSGLVIFQKK